MDGGYYFIGDYEEIELPTIEKLEDIFYLLPIHTMSQNTLKNPILIEITGALLEQQKIVD